ncbi:MAG TPA: hypothetical protein VFI27_00715 [candidate division Zixibacteria bacterium]|nr:hypothetical protein [candidate division Zixibacteria bacterium]
MERIAGRLGILPTLVVGGVLFLVGILMINNIVNNFWPIEVERLDLIRETAFGSAEATSLLRAANIEVILAFLAGVWIAVTGLMLPVAAFLNSRFGNETFHWFVALRQAMWVGLWVAFCTWLQMNRSFGIGVAVLVAAVLIMFEILLQIRSRAVQIME